MLKHCWVALRACPQTRIEILSSMLTMHVDAWATMAQWAVVACAAIGVLCLAPPRGLGRLPGSRSSRRQRSKGRSKIVILILVILLVLATDIVGTAFIVRVVIGVLIVYKMLLVLMPMHVDCRNSLLRIGMPGVSNVVVLQWRRWRLVPVRAGFMQAV